jgi:PAS domain S-box-containing protein
MSSSSGTANRPAHGPASRDQFWVTIVVLLGVALSLGAFRLVRRWDTERANLHLTLQAQAAAGAVRAAAAMNDELLHNLAELLGRRSDLSRAEFAEVARPLLRRHPGLRALEWVPVVPAGERARVEAQAARELGRAFSFTQTNTVGALVRAGERPVHLPVLFAEPVAGNEAALGYDLAVGPTRRQLDQARDLGDLVLSPPIRLVQEPDRQLGYVTIMPVFAGGAIPPTPAERRAKLAGYVQAVLRAGDFLRAAISDAPSASLDVMALDLSPGSLERVVHFLPAKAADDPPVPAEAALREGWHVELKLRLGERTFGLLFRPAPEAVAGLRSWNPWGALGSGLLLTFGGALYLRTALRRTARVEAEVAARTEELSKTSVRLSSEAAARRQAEREATRQLQLLRTLVDAIPDSIYVKDKDGRFLLHNAANRRLLGLAPGDEGAGRTVHDFPATRANAAAYTADDQAVVAGGQAVINREEAFTQPDGSTGWFLTTKVPVRDEQGAVTGIVGVSRDVTARQRERQSLAESEARFRVLFESSPDAIFVENSEGLVLDANPAACRLHGMTRGELLGRHVTELVPESRRAEVTTNFTSLFARETLILESESLAKDGRVIPIELAARRFDYGGQTAALIHVRDISDRRRALAMLEAPRPHPARGHARGADAAARAVVGNRRARGAGRAGRGHGLQRGVHVHQRAGGWRARLPAAMHLAAGGRWPARRGGGLRGGRLRALAGAAGARRDGPRARARPAGIGAPHSRAQGHEVRCPHAHLRRGKVVGLPRARPGGPGARLVLRRAGGVAHGGGGVRRGHCARGGDDRARAHGDASSGDAEAGEPRRAGRRHRA